MRLYYIHDPMCSWCWAFRPVWTALQAKLPSHISVTYLLGGLAPDSMNPMSLGLQRQIQQHWHTIQSKVPGTMFNFDFWKVCEPRRSTYPACRAVIAAKEQGLEYEDAMIRCIQETYYLQSLNVSDDAVLMACAGEVGLDMTQFNHDFHKYETKEALMKEIYFTHQIGAEGFPSLILELDGQYQNIRLDYNHVMPMLNQLESI